ncbi:Chl1 helicase [Mycena indigotica]|uniref:ATP-dependent DNA helicase CHL1 n=1 Tax=Mycena indigotica TaxID=2126181 RepID=A0A8H6SIX6_9AGAR|nr:Chl1 helicase [Mycena indigotica]KAF7299172.1 Chl1 helicase [Mycena indigotica]
MDLSLPTPSDFPAFPFATPYPIQVQLMQHLYSSIENKKVTIVESPTGTGKTLSLLCASLTWLTDERNRAKKGILDALGTETEAGRDWVLAQTRTRRARELEDEERDYETRLQEARKREQAMKKRAHGRVTKRPKVAEDQQSDDPDDAFLPDTAPEDNISPEVRVMEKGITKNSFFDQEEEPTCTKIYYASRTHSQLSQILPELRRLKLSPMNESSDRTSDCAPGTSRKRSAPEDNEETPVAYTRTVALASRKQLCINDKVRTKNKDIDEGCRELLEEKGDKRCQYLPPLGEEERMLDFRDQILSAPKDIEDLASVGRLANTCPYFGSRRAIPQAEVRFLNLPTDPLNSMQLVTLPYNLLIQKTAREALGIDLTNQVVIVDEAHNLIPTLLSLSTCRLSSSLLALSLSQVSVYVNKFRARLSGHNLVRLKWLILYLEALKKFAEDWQLKKAKEQVITVAELQEKLGRQAASINLLEVERYLRDSKIARKIAGYAIKEAENETDPKLRPRRGAVPPLHTVEAFLLSLTAANEDGRLTLSLSRTTSGKEEVEMKYQLLNPAPPFLEVIESARSVILAGGTMSPIPDVINQLFSYLPSDRITSFSCGHIIPENNLQAVVVGKSPRGGELEFKADKQKDEGVIAELGQILLNFAALIPKGMVVFFPSYSFLNTAKAVWQKSGAIARFEAKKKVFFEPEQASQVEQILQEYASVIQQSDLTDKPKGALLFAVIGAKLSEGINFADDLARAVVVVGLPFANLGSAELRERMKYVNQLEKQRGSQRPAGQKDAAGELYENMCMNAVNQSIGRAIRHQNDWASLILLDKRYGSPSIRKKLPQWIGGRLLVSDGFGKAIRELALFYKNKKIL